MTQMGEKSTSKTHFKNQMVKVYRQKWLTSFTDKTTYELSGGKSCKL